MFILIYYEWLPDYCHNCATIGHDIGRCKWLHKNQNVSNEVAKKQKVENRNYKEMHSKLEMKRFARVRHYLVTILCNILSGLDNMRLHKLSLRLSCNN